MHKHQYIFILIAIVLFALSCDKPITKPSFYEFYSGNKSGVFDSTLLREYVIETKKVNIDTIYRSMMGELNELNFSLADSGDIVWITGYKTEVLDTNKNLIYDGFLCHNNLELGANRNFPWQSNKWRNLSRVFTITPGLTEIKFPKGYGIPIPSEQELMTTTQSLNHNFPTIDTMVQYRITIKYFLESETNFKLTPVYMQPVWLVKQYAGPVGNWGEPPASGTPTIDSLIMQGYHPAQQVSCGIEMLANNKNIKKNDIYYDAFGRKYTGHWKIPPGKEYIEFNADKMLSLDKPRKLIMATAHAHPFCQKLTITNQTKNNDIVEINMKQADSAIGLTNIQIFIPDTPVLLDPKYSYTLNSSYLNTSKDTLSAMSVIYLYFEN